MPASPEIIGCKGGLSLLGTISTCPGLEVKPNSAAAVAGLRKRAHLWGSTAGRQRSSRNGTADYAIRNTYFQISFADDRELPRQTNRSLRVWGTGQGLLRVRASSGDSSGPIGFSDRSRRPGSSTGKPLGGTVWQQGRTIFHSDQRSVAYLFPVARWITRPRQCRDCGLSLIGDEGGSYPYSPRSAPG